MWFALALTAAVLWGLSYALSEHVLKTQLTVPVTMLLTGLMGTVIALVLIAFSPAARANAVHLLHNLDTLPLPLATSLCYCLGTLLVYQAIQMHNATSVGFVEITYPLFTAFFAFWLFGAIQISLSTLAGSALIMGGLVLIARGH